MKRAVTTGQIEKLVYGTTSGGDPYCGAWLHGPGYVYLYRELAQFLTPTNLHSWLTVCYEETPVAPDRRRFGRGARAVFRSVVHVLSLDKEEPSLEERARQRSVHQCDDAS